MLRAIQGTRTTSGAIRLLEDYGFDTPDGFTAMSRKIKIVVIIILFVLIISPVAGYVLAKRSEPYQFAVDTIKESTSIKEVLGEVKEIKLEPLGYSIKHTGPHGKAAFEIEIIGTQSDSILFVELKTNLGVWEIVGAKLDGKKISL